jgi:hypothetical protein
MFPWQGLGKHVSGATAPKRTNQYPPNGRTKKQTTARYTRSRGNGYFNRFPWQRLSKHVPGATTRSTRSCGNDSVSTSVQNGRNRKSNIFRRNVSVDTNTHRTIEELNGAVLSIQSAEKLHKECRNARCCSGRLAFPENCLVNILWKQLGKHVPGETVR